MQFEEHGRPTKLNVAIWGPSNSGKTYLGLALARRLGNGRAAGVDTEHGAMRLYENRHPVASAIFDPPYNPERFVQAIRSAEAQGFDAILLDSLSPEWDGPGGCLELHDQAVKAQRKHNSYTAWKTVTPRHEDLLGEINRTRLCVVSTLREKVKREIVDDPDSDGEKSKVKVVGFEAVTRENFEYEYDLVLQLDLKHQARIIKSRLISLTEGKVYPTDEALLTKIVGAIREEGGAA